MTPARPHLPDAVVRRLPLACKRGVLYSRVHGRWPSLREPRLSTEKANWRVVHDRRPLIGQLGDKLAMKAYAHQVCPDLAVPAVLCYSQARRLLLVEELLGRPGESLTDHEFLVFDGRVRLVQVDTGRSGGDHRRRLYTPDWRPVEFDEPHTRRGPVSDPPASLSRMTAVAEALGGAFDFVRVDLYDVAGTVWFGELTPYPGGGLDPFDPVLDRRLGEWWQLPTRRAVRAGRRRPGGRRAGPGEWARTDVG